MAHHSNRKKRFQKIIAPIIILSAIAGWNHSSASQAAPSPSFTTGLLNKALSLFKTEKFKKPVYAARSQLTPSKREAYRGLIQGIFGDKIENKDLSLIIQKTEWQELHAAWLIDQLDRARTNMGRWALHHLSYPHSDKVYILENQRIIRAFLEDQKTHTKVIKILDTLYQAEPSIFAYFDAHNGLSARAAHMYFTFFLIPQSLRARLNKNLVTLEIATWLQMMKSSWSFLQFVGISGLQSELERLFLRGHYNKKGDDGNLNQTFNVGRAFREGFFGIIRYNNPYETEDLKELTQEMRKLRDQMNNPDLTPEQRQNAKLLLSDYSTHHMHASFARGTWGDKVVASAGGVEQNFSLETPFGTTTWKSNWIPYEESSWLYRVGGGLVASGLTVWYDYEWIKSLVSSYSSLKESHVTMRDLRERCVQVKEFLLNARTMVQIIGENVALKNTSFYKTLLRLTAVDASSDFEKLIRMLDAATFDGNNTFFYSRGRVLAVHTLLQRVSKDLIEVLKAIGEVDAYASIATLMKEHQNKQATFSFVEFVESEQPSLSFERIWVPVLPADRVVTNDVVMGGEKNTKAVITGPNGGGKSTILKAVGQAVFLAQSWGIVPAHAGKMTLFTKLRSCIHPEEDLQRGISTFMAEKERMDDIMKCLNDEERAGKALALIDEPYRGTVDAESAQRINSFGEKVMGLSRSAVLVATHVQPDYVMTHFDGYHVGIEEMELNGIKEGFTRTFKLHPGIAHWWFGDKDRRSRFIDWLSLESKA